MTVILLLLAGVAIAICWMRPLGRRVPDHDANPSGPVRSAVVSVLAQTRTWYLLPGRVQGALCNCPLDRGERQ